MKRRSQYTKVSDREAAESSCDGNAPSGPALRNRALDLQHSAGNHAVQELLRKSATENADPVEANKGVQQALGPGRTLDPDVGANLTGVRIHDDAAAAESARKVHALAYTLGNHIVFANGAYAPHSTEGRALLAHELAHTVQQARDPHPRIQRQPATGTTVDVDLVPESQEETERLKGQGINLPTVSQGAWQASVGSPYSTLLPGYSQWGQTCGAASLVAALLIWDREHWDPAHPNSRAVDACDLIILDLERHGAQAAERMATAHPMPQCAGDHACSVALWTNLRDSFIAMLTQIREKARKPGGMVTQTDYEQLGQALYFLWNQGQQGGIGTQEIFQIQAALGLQTQVSAGVGDFDAIFTNAIVTGLAPDEMAQIFWFSGKDMQQHAFLIGRLTSGKWFLSDQGENPPVQLQVDSLDDLHRAARITAASGSWLYVGSKQDYTKNTGNLIPGFQGVEKLASAGGTHEVVRQTVPSGVELCEVDAGYFTIGDVISSGPFVARQYTLADAMGSLPGGGGGGLIVELPAGVFTLYTTSAVSEANLDETKLDASDSSGMLLGRGHAYHHAWLILGTRFGIRRSWFQVY